MEQTHYIAAARHIRLEQQAEAQGVDFLTLYRAEQSRLALQAAMRGKRPLQSTNWLK